jgi:tetratricopeptide (TPR) repeat protein
MKKENWFVGVLAALGLAVLSGCQSTGTLASMGAAGAAPRARPSYTPAGNTLVDELQWLTVQTACVGIYNMAETGDYSVGDPADYYRPGDIREYLAELSGDRTAVDMFYGICFNYAQAAYNDISRYKNHYAKAGVKDWYIAATGNNPRQITLYDPSSRNEATVIMNGVPIKEKFRQNVQAHGDITYHAWLWVIANDDTIYWLDPTWTDTQGYVVWGVVQNGRETYLPPPAQLCAVELPNAAAMDPFNRGMAYMNEEEWDRAIAEFDEAIRQDKNNALAYSKRCCAYAEKGDITKALADVNQAIRLDPAEAEFYFVRGAVYLLYKNDGNKAIADMTTAIRLDPGNPEYYTKRGMLYESPYIAIDIKKDFAKAAADYTEAIRIDPYGFGYPFLADLYESNGDPDKAAAVYDRAIAAFTDAIQRESENPLYYYRRAGIYRNTKDYDRAIADYTAAIRLDPNNANYYSGRAGAYEWGKKDYDRAIADYTMAIQFAPNTASRYSRASEYSSRGRVYEAKKDYDRAIADYEAALKIYPDNSSAQSGLERLRKLVNNAPPTAVDHFRWGLDYAIQDDYDRAIAEYTEAIRLDSQNADYYSSRGEAYVSKKDWDKATADFEAVLKIDPNDEEAKRSLEFIEIMRW